MKEYYLIGELSKIYHLPVSTLRYYNRCGLFVPEYRDPSNGYRYYGRDQLYKLDVLCLLRVLDIPVQDIEELMGVPDPENAVVSYLADHRASLVEQLSELQSRISMVDSILGSEDARRDFRPENETVCVRHFPARTLLLMEITAQPADEREFRTTLQSLCGTPLTEPDLPKVIRGNGMTSSLEYLLQSGHVIYDGAYMEPDSPYGAGNWTRLDLPECDCLTLRFDGNAVSRADAYRRMAEHIRNTNTAAEDLVMEEMLWQGILSSKKGSDIMELRVMLQ